MSPRLRQRVALWLALICIPLALLAAIVVLDDGRVGALGVVAVIAVVTAIGALLAGWFLLLAPALNRIERLSDAVARIAGGTTAPRLRDAAQDEIGDLARNLARLQNERDSDHRTRGEAEDRLRYQTIHDPLTGILNRQHVRGLIEQSLARSDLGELTVVFVDIDDFTLINELWGQSVGDEVIVATASRLRRILDDDVPLGRWAGDEYVIVLLDVATADVEELVAQVRGVLEEPVHTTAGPRPLSASVSVASARCGAGTIDELFHDIDVRLRREKEERRRAQSIDPDTSRLVQAALDEDRIEVWFQPIVQLVSPTGTRMTGAEALVRLRAADDTLRVAHDFLGEIMTTPFARELDARMAAKVVAALADWQQRGVVPESFLMSLNLSPASLRDADLGRSLVELCEHHAVAPACIVLDVSEEAGELDQIISAELRQSGFRLSIDDLGFKRSNFDRLLSVGAEFAKLHRRWLDDEVMLDALVGICQRKGLLVVAEGVETMDQLAMLHGKGVRLCQGFIISPPLPVDEFLELLGNGRTSSGDD